LKSSNYFSSRCKARHSWRGGQALVYMLDSHSTLVTLTSSAYLTSLDYRKDFTHLSLTRIKAIRNGVWRSLAPNNLYYLC